MNKKQFNLPVLQCKRCSHKWIPRNPEKPRICPKCKSPYWDKPKLTHVTHIIETRGKPATLSFNQAEIIKRLEKENKTLKKQLAELQQKLKEANSE
jgi:hypothetical protein